MNETKMIALAIAGIAALTTLTLSLEVVDEGHQGVLKVLGQAEEAMPPGLHFKPPFISSVIEIDVRERKLPTQLAAADKDQLSVGATVSVNWSVNPAAVLDIYKDYGSLDQFEDRILKPRVSQAAKASLSQYSMADLITRRTIVQGTVRDALAGELERYPVTLQNVQIEDLQPPQSYRDAILAKKQAEENAKRAEHELAQQKIEAQKEVNTAEAARDANKARADGQAYATREQAKAEAEAIRAKGEAEADAIRARADAIRSNPAAVSIEMLQRWDGTMPRIITGEGAGLLMQITEPKQ